MAEPTRTSKLLPTLGYVLVALLGFVLFLYLTFPYDAVARRLRAEALRAGWSLEIGGLGPGLIGLRMRDVALIPTDAVDRQPPTDGSPPTPPHGPLEIDRLSLRPSLFPLGVSLSGAMLGGDLDGSIGGVGALSVSLDLEGIRLDAPSFALFTGLEAEGSFSGSLDLEIPREGSQLRWSQADGGVGLDLVDAGVTGGTIVVPIYGQSTPFPLPPIAIGSVTARMGIAEGLATLETLRGEGGDVALLGEGTVQLNDRLMASPLALSIKLKAEPDFVQRLGLLASGINMLPADSTDREYRVARLGGLLGSPRLGR